MRTSSDLHRLTLAGAALALSLMTACDTTGDEPGGPVDAPGDDDGLSIIEMGKEDNFYSATAQEYTLSGTTTVEIEPEFAGQAFEERLARAQELVPYRQTVIGWFLNQYMVEKSHDAANREYGSFKALTKNGSWEDLNLREVDEITFAFDFRQEIAGPLNLLSVLPTTVDEDARRYFDLTIGRISTAEMLRMEMNNEWYRKAPWGTFNPSTVDASRLETVRLEIEAQPRSVDAWFDYARLVEDGILDIGVHFGWDYHGEYHLVHSRATYDYLVRNGFTSPVTGYDEYRRDSGPLTRTVLTPNGPVEIQVSLFWGKPGTETDPDTDAGGRVLEDDMRASLRDRDVTMFSGHSGPFYGFALANWRKTSEGDLDDSEIPELDLPHGRYQVVLAEGCDTYAIGQAFYLNPAKADREHLDIITTTSFSNASTAGVVTRFLDAFIKTDAARVPAPPRLSELLSALDRNSTWFSTMYGVHGIDSSPRRHPWAVTDALCGACATDADCGGPGNRCVRLLDGDRACTFECTADDACPGDFICQSAQSDGWIRTQVCVSPEAGCRPPVDAPPEVRIATVVPNPDRDLNEDGVFSALDDEAVTLVNRGDRSADLSKWAIADNVGVRFTFPHGFALAPGDKVTIFGGGEAEWVAPRGLGLNNRGDRVTLLDARGAAVHEVSWRNARPGAVVQGG